MAVNGPLTVLLCCTKMAECLSGPGSRQQLMLVMHMLHMQARLQGGSAARQGQQDGSGGSPKEGKQAPARKKEQEAKAMPPPKPGRC